ncbi:hypothetical protein Tco_1059200, partial [Tanacetum coccineum]
TYRRDYFVDFEEYDRGIILLGDGRECRIRGTCKVTDEGWVKFHVGQRRSVNIKVIKGSLVVLSGTRRANCVYTRDGQQVTRKTLKGRKQLGEYQTRWKIKKGNVLDSCNQRSTQQCTKSEVAKHLGVFGLSKVFWAEETTMSTYLVKRSPSSAIKFKTHVDLLGFFGWLASIKQGMLEPVKNTGFNESGEHKKTFIGSGVGTGFVQVLQGVEFEVELQEDHTFEVEPHGNVDYVAGLQEVRSQDLIYYHLARDMKQHSTHELFSYREDSNEAAFAVAAVDKIYARESLTFNNTVACKDEIWATKGLLDKAKGNVLSMEIVRD